jgi:hypothetical protein
LERPSAYHHVREQDSVEGADWFLTPPATSMERRPEAGPITELCLN